MALYQKKCSFTFISNQNLFLNMHIHKCLYQHLEICIVAKTQVFLTYFNISHHIFDLQFIFCDTKFHWTDIMTMT